MITSSELELIKNYLAENKTVRDIAKLLNRPYGQVIKIIGKYHLKNKKDYKYWSPEEETALREFVSRGDNLEQISTTLNRTQGSVKDKASSLRLSIKESRKMLDSKYYDEIIRLIKSGKSYREISRELKISYHKVVNFCHKNQVVSLHSKKITECNELKRNGNKRCRLCGEILSFERFYKPTHSFCIKCHLLTRKEQLVLHNKNLTAEQLIYEKLKTSRRHCLKKGIEFNLTLDELMNQYYKQNGKCYYSGEKLSTIPGRTDIISIDRKDSSKGYFIDNVVLCCWIINCMKNKYSFDELLFWSKKIVEYNNVL